MSIVRLVVMLGLDLNSADATFNFSEVVIWSIVEINCGLICACLPSLRPAFRLLGLGRLFGSSGGTAQPSAGRKTPAPEEDVPKPYRRQSRKNPGLFSLTAVEPATFRGVDEEDSYQMIEKTRHQNGVTTTSVEPAESSINEDQDTGTPHLAIEVKRDWKISGEPVYRRDAV